MVAALALSSCGGEETRETGAPSDRPAGTVEQRPGKAARDEARPSREEAGRDRREPAGTAPRGSGFDFYVLSLSWSPTWCGANDPDGETRQCRRGSRNGFIVHGLWPQNERGYPEFCRSRDPDRVPEALGRQFLDIIPSMGLIGHQWRKHGSCSGLSQRDYFTVLRRAHERIALPPALASVAKARDASVADIETAMVAANPGLTRDGIAVTCAGRLIEEIRVCLDRDLNFRACREVDRSGCRLTSVGIPPVR
ncbi:ribonuclease T2 family protein [Ensifer soli]|uniref:ribonuclease T2 family protein n=1 Tax=Ciceribacter sp. sgz301302 TaxID=3342379 RepID=UPI0035B96B35